ncbi:MAG TPA: hypothetical protein DD377_06110 [Firmicutes bacterium]|nr:hypothetical protein [Bacillota bacterium]HBM70896.1 hypothetical protein [Bacillota bacterium]
MNEIEKKISALLEKPLLEKGYSIYEINYSFSPSNSSLSIVLDRKTPISLDEIVDMSDLISSILDEFDPIEGAYTLDVSSSGAEKKIKVDELMDYVGCYVNFHLISPYKGENYLEGELKSVNDSKVVLLVNNKGKKIEIELDRNNIDKARLAIKF